MPIKNFHTTSPQDLTPGIVLVAVVTLHVMHHHNAAGRPLFRMYHTYYPPESLDEKGVPQGARIYKNENEIASGIFPVAAMAGLESDAVSSDDTQLEAARIREEISIVTELSKELTMLLENLEQKLEEMDACWIREIDLI